MSTDEEPSSSESYSLKLGFDSKVSEKKTKVNKRQTLFNYKDSESSSSESSQSTWDKKNSSSTSHSIRVSELLVDFKKKDDKKSKKSIRDLKKSIVKYQQTMDKIQKEERKSEKADNAKEKEKGMNNSVKDKISNIERREIERLKAEIIEKDNELKKNKQQNADLMAATVLNDADKDEIKRLKNEIIKKDDELKKKEQENEDLMQQYTEKLMTRTTNEADKDEIKRLKAELKEKYEENANLMKQHTENLTNGTANKADKDEIKRLRNEIVEKDKELKRNQQENEDLMKHYTEKLMTRTANEADKNEIERLRAELKEKYEENTDLMKQHTEKLMTGTINKADKDEIERLKKQIAAKNQAIAIRISVDQNDLNEHLLEAKNTEIAAKNALLGKCTMRLEEMEKKLEQMSNEKDTKTQRLKKKSRKSKLKKGKKIHKSMHQKAGNQSQYTWGKVQPAWDDNFNKSSPNDVNDPNFKQRMMSIKRRGREISSKRKLLKGKQSDDTKMIDELIQKIGEKDRRLCEYESKNKKLQKEVIEQKERMVELGETIADLNRRLRQSEETSVELLRMQNKRTLFNQTHEDLINGKTKKRLFQPQPQKKTAGWFQWMLVAIIILIILNIFIWSDYLNFGAYFVKEEEKKRNFNPFNGEFESEYQLFWPSEFSSDVIHKNLFHRLQALDFRDYFPLYDILFGAFVGYLLYRLLKVLFSWSVPHYAVSKVEHKVWKRGSGDHRLSSRWSLDGLKISQYLFS